MPSLPLDKIMLAPKSLAGKVVVITGGGTGLGRSMAETFIYLGAKVVIASRKTDVLEKTAREFNAEYDNAVLPVGCDVRDYAQVEALLTATLEWAGRVDVLINNAAGNFISPTEKLSHRAFDTIVDIVLKGTYNTTLAFGKNWISRGLPGNVLNIVATYAWTGSAYVVPSASAKAGVLALTRSLAVEWGSKGIRLNAIAPGPFPTEGAWDRLFPGGLRGKLRPETRIPLGRTGEHYELTNLAAYLISDFAAYITGEVVTIDGGEWLKGAGQFNVMSEIPDNEWDRIRQQIREAGAPQGSRPSSEE